MTCSDSTCCGPPQRWTASPVVILYSLEEAAARGTALVDVDVVNLVKGEEEGYWQGRQGQGGEREGQRSG